MVATSPVRLRGPAALPDFPWDSLAQAKQTAASHPDGIADLSVGTPVDPTPQVVRDALAAASDAHGYPTTIGTVELREAIVSWFERTRGVSDLDTAMVLPTIGSKEMVGWLPTYIGLNEQSVVAIPEIAYPTYDVGARMVGARVITADGLTQLGPEKVDLVWINSPSNPTGKVLGVEHLRKVVQWARDRGAIVASDECYAQLPWTGQQWEGHVVDYSVNNPVPSILDPRVCDGDYSGLIALYSMSKQSNLAGYRAGLVAGDAVLIEKILTVRKHLGMMVPSPVQAAMTAALHDDSHVVQQREVYAERRRILLPAVQAAGFDVNESEAGLYLWATRHESARQSINALAEHGILVAPGDFYGASGRKHVRIALTAHDYAIKQAADRLCSYFA